MSLGSWVLGSLNGLTIGLLAVGMVLVYKTNRFLNLAHAQLGAVSALLLAKLVTDHGWNYWVAFAVAMAVGPVTALFTERFLIRPLRRRSSSPTRLLLLSLGVSQLLAALVYVPLLQPKQVNGSYFPEPFRAHLDIGGVTLSGTPIMTAIVVPVLVLALAAFLRYSFMGKQIRAAANNPDAAALCGISVNRVSAVTWALAGGFASLSAILAAPAQGAFNGASLGPYLLMLTLGAAALGAFVSVPLALLGGLLISLVIQLVSAETSSLPNGEIAGFVLILAIVLVRARATARVFDLSGSIVDALPVTRIPSVLRNDPLVKYHRSLLAGAALIVALVLPKLPYFNMSNNQYLLSLVLIYAIVGVGLTMLLGWGGQVSLGQFGVVALGAYLTARWSADGWSLPRLLLVVGLVGAVVLMLIGLPALRVRGLTLAVTTLGFAVIAQDWLIRQDWVGTSQSFGATVEQPSLGPKLGRPESELDIYYLALGVLVLTLAAGSALRNSSRGRLIMAVRDNEAASSAFGINPPSVKLVVLGVSGFFAGLAGVLWADAWGTVYPSQFSPQASIALLAIPVIGGLGSLGGATAAAVLQYGSVSFLAPHLTVLFGDTADNLWFVLAFGGIGQIVILMQMPQGLAGVAQRAWQHFVDRRAARIVEAAAATDTSVALAVEDVSVHFGGVVALDGAELHVRAGEIVGLIGTNGAGKSTLINVISGHISAQAGSVKVYGQEITDLPPDFRPAVGIARSFQNAALFSGLTVVETIQVALSRRYRVGVISSMLSAPWVRQSEREGNREAHDIIDRFGLSPWKDARVYELSTGTRRICDLAAQVAARPNVLLLDEPTSGVAQRDAEAFGPLLRRIRDELDCAILIVEHDMTLLMGLCDRIYAMESGRVIAEGTPEEIRHNPRVVASYLGGEEVAIGRSGVLTRS